MAQSRDGAFNKLADRFFDEVWFKYDPAQGTAVGFHRYDTSLATMTGAEIAAQTAALHQFEREVERFGAGGLSPVAASDRELLLSQIRGQLLTLEVVRPWEKNPDVYSSGAFERDFSDHEPQFRASGGAPEIGDRAREAGPAAVPIGARESEESAADLYRGRARSRCRAS